MERYHDTPARPPRAGHDATTAPISATPCTDEPEWLRAADARSGEGFDEGDEAFDGYDDVEYWFWNGARLVPASPDEAERLRQREELSRAEWRLLAQPTSGRRWGLAAMWRAIAGRVHPAGQVTSSRPTATSSTGPAMDH